MENLKIKTEYITLAQFLKLTDFIGSGGEAKIACKALNIIVNGENEDRRGRKLYDGDEIIVEDQAFKITH